MEELHAKLDKLKLVQRGMISELSERVSRLEGQDSPQPATDVRKRMLALEEKTQIQLALLNSELHSQSEAMRKELAAGNAESAQRIGSAQATAEAALEQLARMDARYQGQLAEMQDAKVSAVDVERLSRVEEKVLCYHNANESLFKRIASRLEALETVPAATATILPADDEADGKGLKEEIRRMAARSKKQGIAIGSMRVELEQRMDTQLNALSLRMKELEEARPVRDPTIGRIDELDMRLSELAQKEPPPAPTFDDITALRKEIEDVKGSLMGQLQAWKRVIATQYDEKVQVLGDDVVQTRALAEDGRTSLWESLSLLSRRVEKVERVLDVIVKHVS